MVYKQKAGCCVVGIFEGKGMDGRKGDKYYYLRADSELTLL